MKRISNLMMYVYNNKPVLVLWMRVLTLLTVLVKLYQMNFQMMTHHVYFHMEDTSRLEKNQLSLECPMEIVT